MTVSIVRQERILRNGSEYFTIKLPAIIAGDFVIYDIDSSAELVNARKYKPLDFVEITNNDAIDIEVQLGFQDKFIVPKGVIKTITEKPFYAVKVKNISATDSTNEKIVLTMQRQPLTTDEYVRKFKLGSRSLF